MELHGESLRLYEKMGEQISNSPGPDGDLTHFNASGAKIMADYLAKQLADKVSVNG